MFKRIGKPLLIVLIVIQLTVPMIMLFYQQMINKGMEDSFVRVKLYVDSVWMNDGDIYAQINVDNIHPMTRGEDRYLVFEGVDGNGCSNYHTSLMKPDHDAYITFKKVYEFNNVYIENNKTYKTCSSDSWWTLYDRYNEAANIRNDFCEGPYTNAYAVIKVYKGHFEIEDVYLNGYSLDEYLTLCDSGEIDLSRYDVNYFDEFYEIYD